MSKDLSSFTKKGLQLISFRQRSTFELAQKLEIFADKFHLNKAYIPDAIARLEEMGYVNDETFAVWVVTSYTGKKAKGKRFIKHQLDKHHIAPDIQQRALEQITEDEVDTANRILAKKLPSWQHLPFPQAAAHIQSYLYRRGYSTETIHQIITAYKQQNTNKTE